ncbi:N-acetylglucosaminyltransferase [Clostridium sp. Sa3CUN1]|uniref:Peptide O-xylosyltransferase n=1 Tax=Clostridium gallinarum TaxID=2762246 RepID=A0ABR8Q7R0_9CLOT|nr:beta-1,6-N-acetylglucosaminyltransferase [Clostridium gallinarum]MBD7916453.1 N-acetylglucosaminyltransferase [Clostridium gallinarum]
MKMAVIIQCHKNSDIINRIIDFFDDDFDLYIHVDKKSNIISGINIKKNVFILEERKNVMWGRFSQVEATIELFKSIKNKNYKYIHFLSGEDYPVKSLDYIKEFFNNNDKEYIEYEKLPTQNLSKNGKDRYLVYYPQFIIARPKQIFKRLLRIIYREFVLKVKIFQRNLKNIPELYYGSSWFSITGDCMEYILDYINKNEEVYNFFKNSIYPDEMFFQTIIMNSKFKNNIVNNNLRYLDWRGNKESPKNLEHIDIEKAINSSNIFARKINNSYIIDFIDKNLRDN